MSCAMLRLCLLQNRDVPQGGKWDDNGLGKSHRTTYLVIGNDLNISLSHNLAPTIDGETLVLTSL